MVEGNLERNNFPRLQWRRTPLQQGTRFPERDLLQAAANAAGDAEELYDLVDDPGELNNRLDGVEGAGLQQAMTRHLAGTAGARPASPSDGVDTETLEQLRALGYLD